MDVAMSDNQGDARTGDRRLGQMFGAKMQHARWIVVLMQVVTNLVGENGDFERQKSRH